MNKLGYLYQLYLSVDIKCVTCIIIYIYILTGATGAGVLEDAISAGLPSYIIQEEFDRYTGYWWQPIDTASLGTPIVYSYYWYWYY